MLPNAKTQKEANAESMIQTAIIARQNNLSKSFGFFIADSIGNTKQTPSNEYMIADIAIGN